MVRLGLSPIFAVRPGDRVPGGRARGPGARGGPGGPECPAARVPGRARACPGVPGCARGCPLAL
eukprot:8895706-Pyramimonas_sp.AAC.1